MATQREREYELVVVLTPEAGEAEAAVSVDRVAGYIADRGGTVSVRESWGVRRLAYPIQNYREGNYFLMRFELDAGETRELDQTLQASQDVLRHLVMIAEGPRPKTVEEPEAEAEEPAESGRSATEESATAEAEASASETGESPSAEAEATPAATEEAPSAEAEATPAATEEAPSAEAEPGPAAAEEEPVAEPEPPAAAESAEEAVASTAPETEKPAGQQERPA